MPHGIIEPWNAIQKDGKPLKAEDSLGIGFIPVYDSMDAFLESHPDRTPRVLVGKGAQC